MKAVELDQWGRPTGPGVAEVISAAPLIALRAGVRLLDDVQLATLSSYARSELERRDMDPWAPAP